VRARRKALIRQPSTDTFSRKQEKGFQ